MVVSEDPEEETTYYAGCRTEFGDLSHVERRFTIYQSSRQQTNTQ